MWQIGWDVHRGVGPLKSQFYILGQCAGVLILSQEETDQAWGGRTKILSRGGGNKLARGSQRTCGTSVAVPL